MNQKEFIEALHKVNIEIDEHQISQFETYMKLLVEWNEKMNLTSITKEEEIWEKHFYDSILPFVNVKTDNLCDVGSGAGFPGLPVKIVFPDIDLTIVEPSHKRCRFLEEVNQQCDLNVHICCQRAEDFVKDHRESFDCVSARAVARLTILMELCVPLLKVGGTLITLKGKNGFEELEKAQEAMSVLGLEQPTVEKVQVEDAQHINFYFKKSKKTPKKYPRVYGQIKKRPLGE